MNQVDGETLSEGQDILGELRYRSMSDAGRLTPHRCKYASTVIKKGHQSSNSVYAYCPSKMMSVYWRMFSIKDIGINAQMACRITPRKSELSH